VKISPITAVNCEDAKKICSILLNTDSGLIMVLLEEGIEIAEILVLQPFFIHYSSISTIMMTI